jgi:TonB family protein
MRVAAGVLLFAALLQSQTPVDPAAWPPGGVYTRKDGATNPELLRRVEPVYSPEAMRARIQGFVTVQFVVEADGTVGPVRVIKSLNPSLDAAAVDALKKWLFKPGTKDSVPVRVLSNLLLTFSLGGQPPPLTLPAGFDLQPDASTSRWVFETVETPGVNVRFAYPDGWLRPESPTVAIMTVDPVSLASVGVFRPARLPGPIQFPMPLPMLARFSETMRLQQEKAGQPAESLSVGQSTLGSANWLWLELEASTASLPVTPQLAEAMQRIGGVRLWAFNTTVGSYLVQVMCSQPLLKDATSQEREAALAHAQTLCSGILKRMSFTLR